jgi:hypothetical protein
MGREGSARPRARALRSIAVPIEMRVSVKTTILSALYGRSPATSPVRAWTTNR